MTETSEKPRVLIDEEAGERYKYVVENGKNIFTGSSLLDPSQPITDTDLDLIATFHKTVSPQNPNHPWRLTKEERSIEQGQIADPSTFGNWESVGGPLEHIQLAGKAGFEISKILKDHLKPEEEITEEWAKKAFEHIVRLDPHRIAAAASLHDEGREVTHLFYTNDLIGRRMLERIGIRNDIVGIMPDEVVMQVPQDESMIEYMQKMEPEAVMVRIADEFGKRKAGTNRLTMPNDFDAETQKKWGENYINRPYSGRPSDKWIREHLALHNANAPRYFEAMDEWVQGVSTLTLNELTEQLNTILSPTLSPIN